MKKICNKCKIEKSVEDFHKNNSRKNGYSTFCKECKKQVSKNYRDKNKDKLNKSSKDYREKLKLMDTKPIRKIVIADYNDNKRKKIRKQEDPLYKLTYNMRTMVSKSLIGSGYEKNSKTQTIIGLSFTDLKVYLESKFEDWMTWENYGLYNGTLNYGWDIDHITPLASGKTENEIIELNKYTNLQPLCGYINRVIKRNNLS